MLFADTSPPPIAEQPDNPWRNVIGGEYWRLVTPIFVHWTPIHLVLNLLGLFYAGAQIESRQGTLFFALLVFVSAIASNVAQVALSEYAGTIAAVNFGGISGVVYALFAYLWIRQLMNPKLGYLISWEMIVILVLTMVLGFSGIIEQTGMRLANWSHAGGFASGLVVGFVPFGGKSLKRG